MPALIIKNKIYGDFKITEPILIELIKSPALQRLKGIEQSGGWKLHYSFTKSFSRYDHSIGVMLLLRKFGASLEEQAHGLLHDISHTTFSHVADFIFNTQISHSYQDSRTGKAYEIQGINKILKKHKLDPVYILNEKNFTLAERELPNLCADRIDYTLQDPRGHELSSIKPKEILKNLTTKDNKFVFKNKAGAKKFSTLNLILNKSYWCHPLQITIYTLLANVLRESLDKKIISKKDLYKTDNFVIKKIILSRNTEILKKLRQIKNLKIQKVPKAKADLCGKSKIRTVDPYFIKNNKLVKLTKADQDYKNKKQAWEKIAKKGFCIRILNV